MGRAAAPPLTRALDALRRDLAAIVGAALDAVHPARLLDAWLERREWPAGGRPVPVIAAGKAASPMFEALSSRVVVDLQHSLVSSPTPTPARPGVSAFAGGHPWPNLESEYAGRTALGLARRLDAADLLVVLLSGGASAMLAVPLPPLTLDEKIEVTRLMLASGMTIDTINAVRKHLSAVKGGRLAAETRASTLTLAISDVVGAHEDDPSVIGSGPTAPDPSTWHEALHAVQAAGIWERCPARVRQILSDGAGHRLAETPKPDARGWTRHAFHVIGSRREAMAAARDEAARRGYRAIVDGPAVVGEAREAGRALARRAAALGSGRWCLVSSGETTVRVRGGGRGGRNQEVALAAVAPLAAARRAIVLASIGTDGIDGPTDAAGAMVDTRTLDRARAHGLDPQSCLDDNNAYHFFEPLGDLWRPGSTGTNVGDLQVVLAGDPDASDADPPPSS